MKNLIYDFRFLFYGFIVGYLSSVLIRSFTEMDDLWVSVASVVIVIAFSPVIFALDYKIIKQKGDN